MRRLVAGVLVAGLSMAGCEAGEAPPEEAVDGTGGEAESRMEVGEAEAPTPGVLAPINRSGVRGSAEMTPEDDGYTLSVEVEGLEAGARYSAHVHEGTCVDGGPIRLPLGRITADEAGAGSLRMRVDADRLPQDADLFVQVHAPDDRPVACANVDADGAP